MIRILVQQFQRFSISAGAALLVLALFGAVAFASVARLSNQQEAVLDTNNAISNIDQLLTASSDAERAGVEFIVTGDDGAHKAYDDARGHVEDALDVLRSRAEDRPRERSALDTLGPLLGRRFETLNEGIALRSRRGAAGALALTGADTGLTTRRGIALQLQRMREAELVLLAEKTRLMAKHGRTSKAVILWGSVVAFLVTAIALSPMLPGGRLSRAIPTQNG